LWDGFTGVCLVVFAVTIVLWTTTYNGPWLINRGRIYFTAFNGYMGLSEDVTPQGWVNPTPNSINGVQVWTYNYFSKSILGAPDWALAVASGIPPVISLAWLPARLRRRRRERAGLCVVCGYDLRASAERCPECGTPISRPPQ
jgi:hypothetical protein